MFYTLKLLLLWQLYIYISIKTCFFLGAALQYIYIVEQPPERSMFLLKATEKLNFRPLYFVEGINSISFFSSLEMFEFKASLYCV